MTLEQAVSTIDDDIRGGFVAFASKSEAWAVIRAAVPLVVQPDTATNSAMVPCGLPKRVACQYRDNGTCEYGKPCRWSTAP